MDWGILINWVLGGTTLGGIVLAVRFWRQSKKLKDNEVKESDVAIQEKEINLADLYKKNMLELIDLMKANQTENIVNQKQLMTEIKKLDSRLDNIEEYLNGEYQQYISDKKRKAKK